MGYSHNITAHLSYASDAIGASLGQSGLCCVHRLFEDMAEQTPEAAAVKLESQSITYRELNERANQLAHRLINLGVKAETPVGICLDRSMEMIVALLAVLKAGGACLPLDPAYPSERLAFMMADCRPAVILTQHAHANQCAEHGAELAYAGIESQARSTERFDNPVTSVAPENLAYLLYTSGSTGQPKAVAMEHRAFCNLLLWQMSHCVPPSAATTLQFASLNFDVAFQEIFSTLCAGGTIVLVSDEIRRDPAALLHYVKGEAIERLFLPFVALQQFATVAGFEKVTLPRLREVITAGEQLKITPEVKEFFETHGECVLQNQYGPTETHVATAYTLQGKPAQWPPLPPIGYPITGAAIFLLDENLQPVPVGETGELYIGGVCVARGYLRRPEQSLQRFLSNPFDGNPNSRFYKTGDLARYLPDGSIAFISRNDDQIKIRGVRIELGEVEIALSQHPALQHAVVIGAEDQTHGMRLVAYYVTKADQCLTELDLRDFLRAKLPEPMIPAAFVGLKQIPLTPSGKLDRRALPTSSSHRPQTVEPARNALEQKLVSTWENLFHVSPIGIRDSFFDLGGHSLLATQLAVQIEENCGIHVPTGALFQFPTIAALAEHLAQDAVSSSARRIVALNERGTRPAFFCIPPLLNLGQHLGPDQPFYGLELWTPSEQAVESQDVIKQIAGRCIESIRAVQPCGPYYLGGHSFGGPVVFEIAHQLHLQNEEIGLVVLIDPDPPYATPAIAFRRQIEAFVQRLILAPSETIRHYWRALKRRTTRGVLAKHDFAALTPKDKMMHLDGTYRAETLPCPLTLILAGDPLMLNSRPYRPISEPRLDWAEFAGCAVDIQEVPGDHYSIVDEPHVRVLTERLREILSRTMIEQLKPDTSYLCELSPEVIAASCN